MRHSPILNEKAPLFEGETTQGIRRLKDYLGSWLLLFSYSSDFSSICTSEILSFSKHLQEFHLSDCQLLGFSIDPIESHIAWLQHLKTRYSEEINFPLMEDPEAKISANYGIVAFPIQRNCQPLLQPPHRGTFIIDDHGKLRSMLHYPGCSGRSVVEILRLVHALQSFDRFGVPTPEGWIPQEFKPQESRAEELLQRPTSDLDTEKEYPFFVA